MAIVVNDERIEDQVIQGEVMRARQAGQGKAPADLEARVRDRVIGRTLLAQEARNRFKEIPAGEIDKGFESMVNEQGGRENFFKRHQLAEKDEGRVRDHIKENLQMQHLFEAQCKDLPEPTEEEARKHYDAHKEHYRIPPRIHAAHMVKKPRHADDEATYQEMCQARAEVQAGASFAEVADRVSECDTSPGGDLGLIARGQMVESFDAVLFSMEPGEVSPVFMTEFGFHVATVLKKEGAKQQTFEEARQTIAQGMLEQRRDQTIGAFVEELRSKATIVEA